MLSCSPQCTEEVGPGQYDRMRSHMRTHVERERGVMFKDAKGGTVFGCGMLLCTM